LKELGFEELLFVAARGGLWPDVDTTEDVGAAGALAGGASQIGSGRVEGATPPSRTDAGTPLVEASPGFLSISLTFFDN